MKIDFDDLYKYVKNSKSFIEANKFNSSSRLKDFSVVSVEEEGQIFDVISGKVTDGEMVYDCKIENSAKNKYLSGECQCDLFKEKGEPCKHIIALSYYCVEAFENNGYERRKQEVKKNIIFHEYQNIAKSSLTLKIQNKIKLVPILNIEPDGLFVRFKVGYDKMYFVKDVYEFAKNINKNLSFRYGDKLEFLHSEQAFTVESKPLVDIIKKLPNLEEVGLKVDYKLGLELAGDLIDVIYNEYYKSGIEISATDETCLMDKPVPKIKLEMRKDKENYCLETRAFLPRLIESNTSSYLFHQHNLSKCDNKFVNIMKPILTQLNKHRKIEMSENHLKEFFENIIPLIRNYVDIEYKNINVAHYELPILDINLYLDSVGNDITARIACFYGEEEVNIFDSNREFKASAIMEYEVKQLLLEYFDRVGDELIISNDKKQFEFITFGLAECEKIMEIFATDKFGSIKVKRKVQSNAYIRLDGELLTINTDFDSEYTQSEIEQIIASYRLKKNYVKISSDKFVDLTQSNFDFVTELEDITGLKYQEIINKDVEISKFRALQIDKMLKTSSVNYVRDSAFKDLIKSIKNFEDADFELPKSLDCKLRRYQKLGFRWFNMLANYGLGGILADDMGLGKSVQTISFLTSLKSDRPSIVVCPSSLILNWKNEFDKFSSKTKVTCIYGSKKVRDQMISDVNKYDIVITSYELLRQDIDSYSKINFCAAVIDEGQFIKNHVTKNSKAVKMINSEYRFALTGTPIENNVAELWSIFDFIMPGYLYTYSKFKEKYEAPIVRDDDSEVARKLHEICAPFILRRLKKDVLKELPAKIENVISVPLVDEQKDLYVSHLASVKNNLEGIDDINKNKVAVLSYLMKLRQICCSPDLIIDNYNGNSAKLEACLEVIENSIRGGQKVLLFSQFTSMLAIIKDKLIERGISYYLLQGDTKKEDRQMLVNNFNIDDTNVFLLSLKAGGTGLNLTGADVVIHFDPWWNISVQNQASDRAHRIGQQKTVQVFKMILSGTIEERIVSLQEKKQELFDKIIKEGDLDVAKFTKEQLLELLS